jgi:hypothetical protein
MTALEAVGTRSVLRQRRQQSYACWKHSPQDRRSAAEGLLACLFQRCLDLRQRPSPAAHRAARSRARGREPHRPEWRPSCRSSPSAALSSASRPSGSSSFQRSEAERGVGVAACPVNASPTVRILALMEAASLSGRAKDLVGFARWLRTPEGARTGLSVAIATFDRNARTRARQLRGCRARRRHRNARHPRTTSLRPGGVFSATANHVRREPGYYRVTQQQIPLAAPVVARVASRSPVVCI